MMNKNFISVLFAGGWSDKKGIRKPLVLFPILGKVNEEVKIISRAFDSVKRS